MNAIAAQGWKNVGPIQLAGPPPGPHAAVIDSAQLHTLTPLGLLRRLIPDALIERFILPPLNTQLRQARRNKELTEPRRLADLSTQLFWHFTARKIATVLKLRTSQAVSKSELLTRALHKMDHHRFHAVHNRLRLGEEQLKELCAALCAALLTLIVLGLILTVDDRILSRFGQDIRDAGIAHKVADKPHPYGLEAEAAAQVLPLCGLRICVGLEFRLPHNKLSAANMTLALVTRLQPHLPPGFVFIADSLSLTKESLRSFLLLGTKFVFSAGDRHAADYHALWELAQENLRVGHSRTYWNGQLIFQISRPDTEKVSAVLTNAFHPPDSAPNPDIPAVSYGFALACQKEGVTGLKCVLRLPPGGENMTKMELIAAVTGHDLSKPERSSIGAAEISRENLTRWKKVQLAAKLAEIPGESKTTGLKKDEMIGKILTYHGVEHQDEGKGVHRRVRGMNLTAFTDDLRGRDFPNSAVVAFYDDHYGYIDQLNRELYNLFLIPFAGHWEGTVFWSLIQTAILNAYALYYEVRMQHAYNRSKGNRTATMEEARQKPESAEHFVLLLLEELVEL